MSTDAGKKRILILAAVWLMVLAGGGYFVKRIWFPSQKEQLLDETGSSTQYRENITGNADAFSGYCILRSEKFKSLMKQEGIKITVIDDEADYVARAKALKNGDIQWAVFTIDSFVKACTDIGDLPATIVMIIDETKGADAIVAHKSLANISDLDNSNAKIVLTRNSPAEFMSRVVVSEFSLPSLPTNWIEEANGASEVYKQLRQDRGKKPYAYALWEPYVSKALEDSDVHVLLDSSKLSGYIVDVVVFERRFLRDHPDTVQTFIESYQRAAYAYGKSGMSDLVLNDDKTLTKDQAKNIADHILWKTTLENYTHFGLQGTGLKHVEDMIINITNILVQTNAIPSTNLVTGHESKLFYDGILASMQSNSFHPAKKTNVLGNIGISMDLGKVRGQQELPALSSDEWNRLIAVGNIKTASLEFARGSSRLTHRSERALMDLADRMTSLPEYYLMIVGTTSNRGDATANVELSESRAKSVMDYLTDLGLSKNRMLARSSPPTRSSESSVTFVVGQRPY